jgi:hypothetical protein
MLAGELACAYRKSKARISVMSRGEIEAANFLSGIKATGNAPTWRAPLLHRMSPGWKGSLPPAVKELKSPTAMVLAVRSYLLHRHAGRLRGCA